jgi:hypothetical protein
MRYGALCLCRAYAYDGKDCPPLVEKALAMRLMTIHEPLQNNVKTERGESYKHVAQ